MTQDFTIENGKILIDGKPANVDLDFVIKNDGTMEIGKGHYHLSEMADTVKGAGGVGIENGKITYLDNKSGHYLPDMQKTIDVANVFSENGLIGDGFGIYQVY